METGTTVSCFKELWAVKGNRNIFLCGDYLARPSSSFSFILFLLSLTYKNIQIDQVAIIYLLGLNVYPVLIVYG